MPGQSVIDRHEVARRAITESRKMFFPSMLDFARMATKNPRTRVELTTANTSFASADTIYLRVPPQLGMEVEHQIGLCGERDEDLVLKCEKCEVLEDVFITVIHEVAHIVFETFQQTSLYERTQILEQAISIHAADDSAKAQRLRERIEKAPDWKSEDYFNMSELVSPFLPIIINVSEDVRVNAAMIEERPGTRKMFQAQMNKMLRDGNMDYDGRSSKWIDAPRNAQVLMGLYCLVGDLDIRRAVTEDVASTLENDEEILKLCEQLKTARTVSKVYRLSIPLLEALRRLGFMLEPGDTKPQQPEDSEPESDDEDEQEGSDADQGDEGGSDDGASETEDGDDPEPGTDPSPEGGSEGGDSGPDVLDEDEPDGPGGHAEQSPDDPEAGNDQDAGAPGEPEGDSDSAPDDSGDAGESAEDSLPGSDPGSDGAGTPGDGGDPSECEEGSGPSEDGGDQPAEGDGSEPGDGAPADGSESAGPDLEEGDGGSAGSQDSDDVGHGGSGASGEDDGEEVDSSDAGDSDGDGLDAGRPGEGSAPDTSPAAPSSDAGEHGDNSEGADGTPSAGHDAGEQGDDAPERSGSDGSDQQGDGPSSGAPGAGDGTPGGDSAEPAPGVQAPQPVASGDNPDQPPVLTPAGLPATDDDPQDSGGDDSSGEMGADTSGPSGMPQIDGKDSVPAAPSPYTDDDLREDGTPDEVGRVLTQFGGHDDAASSSPSGKIEEDIGMSMRDWHNAVERMMQQMDLFDQPSLNINFINISDYEPGKGPWADRYGRAARTTVDANEALMADATHRLRMLLKENERGRWETNLRRGRLNTKALGQRAPVGDDRVFRKKTQPGKRDYFIHLGMDTSGSTCRKIEGGVLLDSMKAATGAMATMLSRLGIAFSVTAHSGDESSLELFHVKKDREPWGPHQQEALAKLQPYSANVDGHTLEYYRKLVQRRQETDRIILYFTDGAMPMSNYDEELEILQREIEMCKQLGIHLVGIGCGTDSPKDHGLDTIRMDGLEDIGYVVDELKKRILQHAGQQV